MKDNLNISIDFNGKDTLKYKLSSRFKNSSHFLPYIVDMPTLVNKISSTYEKGARYLVEKEYLKKEDMRKILEESVRGSIDELNKILDLVKLEDDT